MSTEVTSQVLTIPRGTSKIAHNHGLVLTVKDWSSSAAKIVFGAPGGINSSKNLELGDACLYQTPDYGIVELRLMSLEGGSAELLLTKVSPRLGFSATIDATDEENSTFTQEEIQRIHANIEQIKISMIREETLTQEQKDYLSSTLDEIKNASERMGRKDWIMYVGGTITSIITSAAFAPEAARALVNALNSNFSWLFHNMLRLLGA